MDKYDFIRGTLSRGVLLSFVDWFNILITHAFSMIATSFEQDFPLTYVQIATPWSWHNHLVSLTFIQARLALSSFLMKRLLKSYRWFKTGFNRWRDYKIRRQGLLLGPVASQISCCCLMWKLNLTWTRSLLERHIEVKRGSVWISTTFNDNQVIRPRQHTDTPMAKVMGNWVCSLERW